MFWKQKSETKLSGGCPLLPLYRGICSESLPASMAAEPSSLCSVIKSLSPLFSPLWAESTVMPQ